MCPGLLHLLGSVEERTKEPKDQERARTRAKEGEYLSMLSPTPHWIRVKSLSVGRSVAHQAPVPVVVLEPLQVRHRFQRTPVEARLGGAIRARFQSLCSLRDASRRGLGRLGPIPPRLCSGLGRSQTARDPRDPLMATLRMPSAVIGDRDRGQPRAMLRMPSVVIRDRAQARLGGERGRRRMGRPHKTVSPLNPALENVLRPMHTILRL
jgi:hypothetical protein